MFGSVTRRGFLNGTLQAGTAASLAPLSFLAKLPPLSAAEVTAPVVGLSPDIEPLVRLIEETPRPGIIGKVARQVKDGLSYQRLLSAIMLAGVRSIKPRPVGFQFHAVLVVNSAHLASLASPDKDRWLPIFWSLDNFKQSQATNASKNAGWQMPALDNARLPQPVDARQRFVQAMDNWDVEAADPAIAALARSAGATEVIELFWRYGARDFRDIGHKAIFVANAWRTLQTIGWRHAEPVLRSLAFALLDHEGDNPAKRDGDPDRPWRENLRRAESIRSDWLQGRHSPEGAQELLAGLRSASVAGGPELIVGFLKKGIHPDSLWEGLFLQAGELLMRQPGIIGLHCVTSINALHYGYQTTGNDNTRRMLLLQAAAFLPLFRAFMTGRGQLADLRLDALEKGDLKGSTTEQIEDIFGQIGKSRLEAARKTLCLLERQPDQAPALMTAARRLVFAKGVDSHDYKFSSAALEDFYHVGPRWRPYYLASSMFHLQGSSQADNDLIRRTREALA